MTARVVLRRPDPDLGTVLEAIAAAASATGIETHLVGGFVRDRLLGVAGKDIDLLAVGGDGAAILEMVAGALGWAPPVRFERFGTAQVRGDGFVLEAVRARAESYDPASRRPEVRPGTLEEDIWRRDFTVNTLTEDLHGVVHDVTGRGLADLTAGILRTPLDPSLTFSEDPLRMLRCARFAAQLGFTVDAAAMAAMRGMAERCRILSSERVAEELRRLLTSAHPRAGLEVLRDSGVAAVVVPEVQAMVGVEQGGWHRWDVFDHSTRTVEGVEPGLVLRTAALCHDIGKPPTHARDEAGRHTFHDHPAVGAALATAMLQRLRFSNDEVGAVAALVRHHLRPIQYRPRDWSDSAVRRLVRDIGPQRADLLALARADTRASAYPSVAEIDALGERMEHLDAGGVTSAGRPLLRGEELMARANRPAGPWIGCVLRALDEAMLEGEVDAGDPATVEAWLQAHENLLRE